MANRDTYHHGALPQALIREGAGLLAEKGLASFSMREVARRAGVAVAAPSHHFGSARGLLTGIATDGFAQLAERMATTAGSPEDRASAMCRAYVAFAKECPGHAAVMFQLGLLNQEDPAFIQQSSRAFAQLSATLAKAAPANAAKLSQATRTLWSAVHGLVALKMLTPKEADEIISFAVRAVVSELRRDST